MPFPLRSACAAVLLTALLAPSSCEADTGGLRFQAQDIPGDQPPSAQGTVAELRAQLDSDDPVIRSAAAGRLIGIGTVEASQAIEEVLLRGKEPAVVDLLKVIGASRDPRLLPMVVMRLRGTTDGIVEATFACLECFDRERVADAILPVLASADLGVAEVARLVEALGRTRHRKAVPKLIELFPLADPLVHDRVVAALFLVTGHRFPDAPAWKAWWERAQGRSREEWQEEALHATQGDPDSDVGVELARTKIELLTLRLSQVADQPEARLALVREALTYKHAPQVRAFGAVEALKLDPAGRAKALPWLFVLAQDPSEEARAAALEAIGEIAGAEGVAPQVRREATDVLGPAAASGPTARVRIAAIRGLAKLPPELAVERVRPPLEDVDRAVRLAAIETLGRMASPEAVRELIGLLPRTNHDPDLRKAVVDAMGESGAPETVSHLTSLLPEARAEDARPLRWAIANSLSKIKSPDGLVALRELARDKFLDVRVKAIQGLGETGGEAEVPFLAGVLKSGDPKERSAAAIALGRTGQMTAVTSLLGALAGDPLVAADAWKGVLLVVGGDRARAIEVARRLMDAQDWSRAVELLGPVVEDSAFAESSPVLAREARDRQGISLLGVGRHADALPFLKESAEESNSPLESKLRYAGALSALQRHAEALALVDRWQAEEPPGSARSWELKLARVGLLRASKDLVKGAAEAEKLAKEPGVPEAVREKALELLKLCQEGIAAAAREESVPLWKVSKLLREMKGERRVEALAELKQLGRKAVLPLVKLAGGTDPSLWMPASQALSVITGISHPLDEGSTEEDRGRAIDAWRAWYDRK